MWQLEDYLNIINTYSHIDFNMAIKGNKMNIIIYTCFSIALIGSLINCINSINTTEFIGWLNAVIGYANALAYFRIFNKK